jgi:uridine kinase
MPLVKKNGVIGIAGVSSTGKTTLCQELKKRYPDKFIVHNKISRREQLDHAGLTMRL